MFVPFSILPAPCSILLIPYTLYPIPNTLYLISKNSIVFFAGIGHFTDVMKEPKPLRDAIPDVRDGLTQKERAVLVCLNDLQQENGDRNVPTILLWGELIERGYDISRDELNEMLARLGAMRK